MLPDRVSNPGPLTYESGALPISLRGPAQRPFETIFQFISGRLPERGRKKREMIDERKKCQNNPHQNLLGVVGWCDSPGKTSSAAASY